MYGREGREKFMVWRKDVWFGEKVYGFHGKPKSFFHELFRGGEREGDRQWNPFCCLFIFFFFLFPFSPRNHLSMSFEGTTLRH